MESLLKPVTLSPDVDRILQEIRTGTENALYGASSAESEELFAKHVLTLVEGAGLPVLQVMHYRWFLRELARLWRTRQGRDLAFHLELCIRKWVGLGLEPRTLQFLVSEAHQRLKGKFEVQSGNDECRTESADVQARISHPPITPIAEDSSESVRNPNLCKSVESVDSPPAQASAESVKSVDVRSPDPDSTTKPQRGRGHDRNRLGDFGSCPKPGTGFHHQDTKSPSRDNDER